jgi:hypothetical protein
MSYDDDGTGLGARFWLKLFGLCIAGAIAVGVVFFVVGWAWYAWGLLGMFIFFGAVLLAFGYIVDKREERRRSAADAIDAGRG